MFMDELNLIDTRAALDSAFARESRRGGGGIVGGFSRHRSIPERRLHNTEKPITTFSRDGRERPAKKPLDNTTQQD